MSRRQQQRLRFLLVVLAIVLAGCRSDEVAPPSATATTGASGTVATVVPAPTVDAPATPTPDETAAVPALQDESLSAENTPDTDTQPDPSGTSITLAEPADGATITAGVPLTVRGAVGNGDRVRVVLLQAVSNTVLVEGSTAAGAAWALDLTPPSDLVGPLLLRVALQDAGGSALAEETVTVLSVPPTNAATAIRIVDPLPDATVAPGRQFSMVGEARFAGETETVTLRLLADACTTVVATIAFDMLGSGPWEGFMAVPATVSGPVCAVAIVGVPDSADARSAYVPLTVAPPDP